MNEKLPYTEKLPLVEVFVPAGACGCTFSHWMERVWAVLLKYRGKVEYKTLTNQSPRADELGIVRMGIAINGKVLATSELEAEIQNVIAICRVKK